MLLSKTAQEISNSYQELIVPVIDYFGLVGIENIIKQRDQDRDTYTAKKRIKEHGDKTHHHVKPVLKHHPIDLDEVTPSAFGLFNIIHLLHKKKASVSWQVKYWHALRDSNPKPSDP